MPTSMTNVRLLEPAERAALRRLIEPAKGDTGQSRRVAEFLLACWNAGECGGFDVTDRWLVDAEIAADMTTVFRLVARCHVYPNGLGYEEDFQAIVCQWRPDCWMSQSSG